MFIRYFLISLLFVSPIHAVEEKKAEENLTAEVAKMAEPEAEKPDREKEISTLIEKSFRGGKAVWLGDVDDAFLALYKENTLKETQGAVLLLHDLGANADWTQLINPLRLTFPKKGWNSLSLQLPMVSSEEDKDYLSQIDEAVSRVKTGIEFLKQKDISKIVIVGHGAGSAVGVLYLTQNPEAPVSAFVAISLPGERSLELPAKPEPVEDPDSGITPVQPKEKSSPAPSSATSTPIVEEPLSDRNLFAEIEKITIPFLDVYAQQDHQEVVREAEKRLEIMQQTDNQSFLQWEMEGADHYFRGTEELLIKRLRGWLKKHVR